MLRLDLLVLLVLPVRVAARLALLDPPVVVRPVQPARPVHPVRLVQPVLSLEDITLQDMRLQGPLFLDQDGVVSVLIKLMDQLLVQYHNLL